MRTVILALVLSISSLTVGLAQHPLLHTAHKTLMSSGIEREYLLHVPPHLPRDQPVPLVFALHGGNSNGAQTEILTGFSLLADVKHFLVVYPEAIEKNWNDGRRQQQFPSQRFNINDVQLIDDIITAVSQDFSIDANRIYVTGISNGAMMTHLVAVKLSEKIAAAATVAGSLAQPESSQFAPKQPVSMLLIHGTADPLAPYRGGGVDSGRRGEIIASDQITKLWVDFNGCKTPPETGDLPDLAPFDQCHVHWQNWRGGRNGTDVTLYTIEGGGHTWPGSLQYLPKFIIGPVCRDFHATAVIWDFFEKHPKRNPADVTR